jgi:hypothetical protein
MFRMKGRGGVTCGQSFCCIVSRSSSSIDAPAAPGSGLLDAAGEQDERFPMYIHGFALRASGVEENTSAGISLALTRSAISRNRRIGTARRPWRAGGRSIV